MCDDYSVQLWLAAMGLDVSNAVTQMHDIARTPGPTQISHASGVEKL